MKSIILISLLISFNIAQAAQASASFTVGLTIIQSCLSQSEQTSQGMSIHTQCDSPMKIEATHAQINQPSSQDYSISHVDKDNLITIMY